MSEGPKPLDNIDDIIDSLYFVLSNIKLKHSEEGKFLLEIDIDLDDKSDYKVKDFNSKKSVEDLKKNLKKGGISHLFDIGILDHSVSILRKSVELAKKLYEQMKAGMARSDYTVYLLFIIEKVVEVAQELFKNATSLHYIENYKPAEANLNLQTQLDDRNKEIAIIKKELDNFLSEIGKLFESKNMFSKLQSTDGIYDTKLNAVKDKINELVKNQNKSSDNKQKDAEIANLKKENDKLENEKNEAIKFKTKAEKEKSDLNKQLDNLKKEVKSLEEKNHNEQVNALIKQRDDLQKQIEAKNAEAEKNIAKIKELKDKISSLENNKLGDSDKNNNNKIKELEDKNKKLLAELAKLKKSKDKHSETPGMPKDISVFNKIAPSKTGSTALLIFSGAGCVAGLSSGSFVLAFLISCPVPVFIVALIASGSCLVTGIFGIGVGVSNLTKSNIANEECNSDIRKKKQKPKYIKSAEDNDKNLDPEI